MRDAKIVLDLRLNICAMRDSGCVRGQSGDADKKVALILRLKLIQHDGV